MTGAQQLSAQLQKQRLRKSEGVLESLSTNGRVAPVRPLPLTPSATLVPIILVQAIPQPLIGPGMTRSTRYELLLVVTNPGRWIQVPGTKSSLCRKHRKQQERCEQKKKKSLQVVVKTTTSGENVTRHSTPPKPWGNNDRHRAPIIPFYRRDAS